MLRYRVARHDTGHYFVVAVLACAFAIDRTYATRSEAERAARWLNSAQPAPCQRPRRFPFRWRLMSA